jgi:hypothetical protein
MLLQDNSFRVGNSPKHFLADGARDWIDLGIYISLTQDGWLYCSSNGGADQAR